MPKKLTEQDRLKLDGIVEQMVANNEADTDIQFVVEDFKNKYGVDEVLDVQETTVKKKENPITPTTPNKPNISVLGEVGNAYGVGQLPTPNTQTVQSSGQPQRKPNWYDKYIPEEYRTPEVLAKVKNIARTSSPSEALNKINKLKGDIDVSTGKIKTKNVDKVISDNEKLIVNKNYDFNEQVNQNYDQLSTQVKEGNLQNGYEGITPEQNAEIKKLSYEGALQSEAGQRRQSVFDAETQIEQQVSNDIDRFGKFIQKTTIAPNVKEWLLENKNTAKDLVVSPTSHPTFLKEYTKIYKTDIERQRELELDKLSKSTPFSEQYSELDQAIRPEYQAKINEINNKYNESISEYQTKLSPLAKLKASTIVLQEGLANKKMPDVSKIGSMVLESLGVPEYEKAERLKSEGVGLTPDQKIATEKVGNEALKDFVSVYKPSADEGNPASKKLVAVANHLIKTNDEILKDNPEFVNKQVSEAISNEIANNPKEYYGVTINGIPTAGVQQTFGLYDINDEMIAKAGKKLGIPQEYYSRITDKDIKSGNILGSFTSGAIGETALGIGGLSERLSNLSKGYSLETSNELANRWEDKAGFWKGLYNPASASNIQEDATIVDLDKTSDTYLQNIKNPDAGSWNLNLSTVLDKMFYGGGMILGLGKGGSSMGKLMQTARLVNTEAGLINKAEKALELGYKAESAIDRAKYGTEATELLAKSGKASELADQLGMFTYGYMSGFDRNYRTGLTQFEGQPNADKKALVYAGMYSFIENAVEQMGFSEVKFVRGLSKTGTQRMADLVERITSEGINSFDKKTLKENLKGVIKSGIKVGGEITSEVAEEIATNIGDIMIKMLTGANKDPNADFLKDQWNTAVHTVIQMALTTGLGEIRQKSPMRENVQYQVALQPEAVRQAIKEQENAGKINTATAIERMKTVNTLVELNNEIPQQDPISGKVLSTKEKIQYLNEGLKERLANHALEKTTDEVQKKRYEQIIKEAQEAKIKILETPTLEEETPQPTLVVKTPEGKFEVNNPNGTKEVFDTQEQADARVVEINNPKIENNATQNIETTSTESTTVNGQNELPKTETEVTENVTETKTESPKPISATLDGRPITIEKTKEGYTYTYKNGVSETVTEEEHQQNIADKTLAGVGSTDATEALTTTGAPIAETATKIDDAFSMANALERNGKILVSGMGDKVSNYTNKDGIEVSLKDDESGGYVNNLQVQGDVMIDYIGNETSERGKGFASQELDRILLEADKNDLSVSLIVDSEGATTNPLGGKQGNVGLTNKKLKEWYAKRGFIFDKDSRYGYRPKKSDNANQYVTKSYKAKNGEIDVNNNLEGFSDPDTLKDAFREGKLESNKFYEDGDGNIYKADSGKLKIVDNVKYSYTYKKNADGENKLVESIEYLDEAPSTTKSEQTPPTTTKAAPIAETATNEALESIKGEPEKISKPISEKAGEIVTVNIGGKAITGTVEVDEGGKATITSGNKTFELDKETPYADYASPVRISDNGEGIEVNGETYVEQRFEIGADGKERVLLIKEDGTVTTNNNPTIIEEIKYQTALQIMDEMSDAEAEQILKKYDSKRTTPQTTEEGISKTDGGTPQKSEQEIRLQEAIEEIQLIEDLALEEIQANETSAKLIEHENGKTYLVKKNEDGTYTATLNGRKVRKGNHLNNLIKQSETQTKAESDALIPKLQQQVNDLKSEVESKLFGKEQTPPTTTKAAPIAETATKTRKGDKQIKKGLSDLAEAKTDIDKLNAAQLLNNNVDAGAEMTTDEKKKVAESVIDANNAGYQIYDLKGKKFNEGMHLIVDQAIPDENLPEGEEIITKVLQPQINKDGKMVQPAKVVVSVGTKTQAQPTTTKEAPATTTEGEAKQETPKEKKYLVDNDDNVVEVEVLAQKGKMYSVIMPNGNQAFARDTDIFDSEKDANDFADKVQQKTGEFLKVEKVETDKPKQETKTQNNETEQQFIGTDGTVRNEPTSETELAQVENEIARVEAEIAKSEEEVGGETGKLKVSEISVRPDVFQFKQQDEKSGVNSAEKLEGDFDKNLAGTIAVWKDTEGEIGEKGKVYVVDGHHRLDLANRKGQEKVNVFYIDANTAKEARIAGAMANISQGRGTAIDASKVFREGNKEQMKAFNPKSVVGKQGKELAKLNDDIFTLVATGKIKVKTGIAIAQVPKELQSQLAPIINKVANNPSISDAGLMLFAKRRAEDVKNGLLKKETVQDLFGTTEQISNYAQQAELESKIINGIKDDAKLLLSASRNADVLESANSQIDTEKTEAEGRNLKKAVGLLEIYRNRKSVQDILKDATSKFEKATTQKAKEQIANKAISDIKEAVQKELDKDFSTKENPKLSASESTPTTISKERFNALIDRLKKAFPKAKLLSKDEFKEKINKLGIDVAKLFSIGINGASKLQKEFLDNKNEAEKLAEKGYNRKQAIDIFIKTGWYKDEGVWKMELPNPKLKISKEQFDEILKKANDNPNSTKGVSSFKLSDVVDENWIGFEAYPNMKDLLVEIDVNDSNDDFGSLNETTDGQKQLYINLSNKNNKYEKFATQRSIDTNRNKILSEEGFAKFGYEHALPRIINHEIQHFAQSEESGFDKGTSLRNTRAEIYKENLQRENEGYAKRFDEQSKIKGTTEYQKVYDRYFENKGEVEARANETQSNAELALKGIQKLETPNGVIYGAKFDDGSIYINPDYLSSNSALHEFSHLWEQYLPEEWAKGVEIFRDSIGFKKALKEINDNSAYDNLTKAEKESEALNTLIGRKGVGYFNSNIMLTKFKNWLDKFFKTLGDKLGIRKLTPDDKLGFFTDKVLGDLLGGKEVKDKSGKEKEGTQFQIIGEKGAENNAVIKENLSVARNMELAGKTPKEIYLATGWERDVKDKGLWKYDLPDVEFIDINKILDDVSALKDDGSYIVKKLSEVVKGELLTLYPELSKIKIYFRNEKDPKNIAEYQSGTNKGIFINGNRDTIDRFIRERNMGKKSRYNDTNNVSSSLSRLGENTTGQLLVHELQHFVQEQEGFARGGSINDFINGETKDILNEYYALEDKIDAKENLSESETKRYNELKDKIKKIPKELYEKYLRIAGEVESRNVEERFGISDANRKKTLISETEDVHPDSKIYFYESGTPQFMYVPSGANFSEAEKLDLEVAKKMLIEGIPMNKIQQVTNWTYDTKDGWQFEVDDSVMKIKKDISSILKEAISFAISTNSDINKLAKYGYAQKLKDIIEHSELFDKIKELEDVNITFSFDKKEPLGITYTNNIFTVNLHNDKGANRNTNEIAETILHELQHIIQGKYNLSKGGNPDMYRQSLEKIYDKTSNEFRKKISKKELDILSDFLYRNLLGEKKAWDTGERRELSHNERKNTPILESQKSDMPLLVEVLKAEGLIDSNGNSLTPEEIAEKYGEKLNVAQGGIPQFMADGKGQMNDQNKAYLDGILNDIKEGRTTLEEEVKKIDDAIPPKYSEKYIKYLTDNAPKQIVDTKEVDSAIEAYKKLESENTTQAKREVAKISAPIRKVLENISTIHTQLKDKITKKGNCP